MSDKPRELRVRIGTYEDKDGNAKGRYVTIGREITTKDGGKFFKVDAIYLNPRIPADKDGSVIVNIQDAYDPDKQGQRTSAPAQSNNSTAKPKSNDAPFDDEIPF